MTYKKAYTSPLVRLAESLSRAIAALPPAADRERLMLCGQLSNVVDDLRLISGPAMMYQKPAENVRQVSRETVAPADTSPV